MQQHPILIPFITRSNRRAWVATIRLQAGALGLSTVLDDANFTADAPLVRTLAPLTKSILESIPADAQTEAIHGNPELKLHPLLIHITNKFNRTSPADHEALDLKSTRTLLLHYDNLDEYFPAHRVIRSQILAAAYSAIPQERTTIKLLIRGLANHPDFRYVVTTWASQTPSTIQ